jgi:hypothetical protein
VSETVDRIALHLPEHVDVDRELCPSRSPIVRRCDTLGEQERGARVAKIIKTDALDACSLEHQTSD